MKINMDINSFENIRLEDFKEIKLGWTIYCRVGNELFAYRTTSNAFYNGDCDEPDWEIETENGTFCWDSVYVKKYSENANKGKTEMRSDNDAYMIFVLGYDLLQKKLTSMDDCPCDIAYETCIDIYNEFLDGEEAEQDKSEYECLQDWIENHPGTVDRFIEQNFRLAEDGMI